MFTRKLIALALIVLFVSACGSAAPATQPPPPTDTAAPPTATVPPTATPIPPTPTPEFQQYYTEEFDKDLKYWPLYIVDGNNGVIAENGIPSAVVTADAGWLNFDLQRTWLWAYSTYDPFDYQDVRIDARVENQGTNNNNISLICRYKKGVGWYEFNIANNGLYWIYNAMPREDGYVRYKQLTEGGSNVIKQGQAVNEYAIICQGSTLTLFINGKSTKQISDNALSSGKVGVSVSSFDQLPVKVNFDWVKISQP